MGRLTDWSDRVVRETKERRELDAKEERESKAEAHASSTKVGGKISSTVFRWNLPAVVTALATLTFAATAVTRVGILSCDRRGVYCPELAI